MTIDWTKPIELATDPPRPARVVSGPTRAGNYDVEADWGEPHGLMSLFVGPLSGFVCGYEYDLPRVRNVAATPDLAAELAEALREIAKEWPGSFAARRARTALAKYEAQEKVK